MKKYCIIAATLLLALVNPNAHAMNKRKGDALEQPVAKKTRKKRGAIERTIPCPYCPDMCANNQALSRHRNAEHSKKHQQALADAKKVVQQALIAGTAHELLAQNSPAPAPTVPCPTCPRKFASAQGLGVHKKYCTAEDVVPKTLVKKNLYCDGCQKTFKYEGVFTFHTREVCKKKSKALEHAPLPNERLMPIFQHNIPLQAPQPPLVPPAPLQRFGYDNSQPAFGIQHDEPFPELKYEDERNYL